MSTTADRRLALVTGTSGFVGSALCAELLRRGWKVRAAVRSSGKDVQGVETAVVGNIDPNTDWTDALHDVDVVFHLAARVHVMKDSSSDPLAEFHKVNLHGTENLARASALAGVSRLVYASSVKVNGESTQKGGRFSEIDAPAPQDAYGVSKWQAEQALHEVANETGLEVVIVRSPLVYGPGVKGNFLAMLQAIDKGIPLPLASVRNQRSLVYLENLVDALIQCSVHPAATNQTYLVSDGEDVSTPDLLRALATGMGRPARLMRCPPGLLHAAGSLLGIGEKLDRLLGSLQVDDGKIRRQLNWVPPCTLQQGLHATAQWYRTIHT